MRLVAITGKARHGKGTLAKAFIAADYRRTAFADALKEIVALVADEPTYLYYDDAAKEEFCPALGMTRRKALQLVGTEGMRKIFGPDVWVGRVLRAWERDQRPLTVIDDCRFDNEASLVRDAGGIVIRVVRPGLEEITTGAVAHASEAGVSDGLVDVEILNDGTPVELQAEGRKVIEAYRALREDMALYRDCPPEAATVGMDPDHHSV